MGAEEYKPEDEHELLRSVSPVLLHKDSADALVPRDLESDAILPRPRAISTSLRPNVISWAGPDDPTNPQNWSKGRKWLVSMCCIVPSFSSRSTDDGCATYPSRV
ncbi:hypothetical protein BDZ89DRAFT_364459 [Hymenopellis radicata]|nr:hypothetical protein BDZ89DRAFT_364459 [Hymenopellis radicata]